MSESVASSCARGSFVEFSPTRNRDTDKENDVAVLSLHLFSKATFVSFGTVKIGTSKSTALRIENPTEFAEAVLTVDKIPSSKGFSVDNNTFTIRPLGSHTLTLTWTPTEEGGIRELIVFNANGIVKHQAILLGKAEAPQKKKRRLWDAIKKKRAGEKGSPYRGKWSALPTKMAANKTLHVTWKQQYEPRSPLASLNDGKTGRDKSTGEHGLLEGYSLKSKPQKPFNAVRKQWSLASQENHSSLVSDTSEKEMKAGSGSLAGKLENKDLAKILKTLSPIGTPERFQKIMPHIQPVGCTAAVTSPTCPAVSLNDALALIDSGFALVNRSTKDSSTSSDFSDSLEFKSEDPERFKAHPDSPEESMEPRLTFFVTKKVGGPKAENPERPKILSFNCETVIKSKAPATNCQSGQRIKKSRRRLMEKTLELSEGSSQCESGPGTPHLPVIEPDTRTAGSLGGDSQTVQEFNGRPTARLCDAQLPIGLDGSSPPTRPHLSFSSPPHNVAPMTFTISSPLPLDQSSPLHSSDTSHPQPEPSRETDILPRAVSEREDVSPVRSLTKSRKRKSEEYLRGATKTDGGGKSQRVKKSKTTVAWKSQPVKSTQERRKSQRRSIKSKGSPHAMTTSIKTLTSSVSTQTQPASAKLPLRGAHARRSLGAEHGKCVKMAPVAMSKLIFVKTTRTAIPRHPLPFAAKNMFYDERWIEKQERAFTWWLNYVLTPDDFKVNTESTKVNAAPLAMGCSDKFHVPKAPTKEEMSFSTYTARRKLNRLRRAACQLFTSETMVKAIKRLELEVEAKRLLIRKDRHLWKDIGERQKVLNWLLSYNPLWLRIGLETIFGEMISLESNSDAVGLAMFILQRLLWNPDIAAEFRHSKVPHLYKDGHEEALSSFTLKKLLLLVCFLDKAKASRLIEHDPCLFCVDAEFKTSKDLLLAFSRDFLSGEGILPRHLGFLGLPVSHVQTPLDEFSYAVVNLAVDLKCGIRLVRVMELLIKQWGLSAKLRQPAISRLQKIHNVDIALQVLKIRGVDLKDEHGSVIDSRDIVDGHREKTLSLLWKIIFSFQVEVILNEGQLREEILFLRRTLRSKRRLASVRAGRGLEPSALKTKAPYEHRSAKVVLLMEWARAVCDFYNLTLENFTVTFSDGRVLCYLIHHYHPSLISEESLRHSTTQTVDCSSRGRLELNCSAIDSDCSFDDAPESPNGPESPSAEFKKLLENEKSNFGLVNAAVAFLGGVPSMINPADMSNTIPNEQVVMCYLSFLCARLLDLRNETRAARVIQGAWRTYRITKDLQVYKERNAAAAKIQRAVKRLLQRRRARNQNAACVIIQSAWRGFVIRKRLRLEKEAQLRVIRNRAATIIQAQWRMFSARRYYQRVRSTAVVVQARWRMKRAASAFVKIRRATAVLQRYSRAWIHGRKVRTRYVRLKAAAVTMQRGYRLWKIQKTQRENRAARVIQSAYKKWLVERMAERTAAAVQIQSFYRTQRCLRQYRKIQRSALLIQAHCRGVIQRSRFQRRKRQHHSAVVIQSAFRGHRVRKRALRIKRAAVVIQRWYRASARRAAERQRFVEMRRAARTVQLAYRKKRNRDSLKRRHRAATVIQAAFRKFACRWRYLALRNATVVIQQKLRAAILARKTKEEYGALRKAALTIQAYWRGRADRMRIKKYHRSATLIRAHYRRRKAQAEFRSKKAAAVVIQRRYRAHVLAKKTREAFLQKKAACATIAAGFRGMKVRADLQKKRKAATVIQSALRMYSARKRYRLLQSATVIIQCRYRARLCCRAERRKYEEQKKAALKIQAVYRGWRGREEFKKRIHAVSFIQAAFRTHRVRKAYLATKCAAVILQERYRAKIRMAEQMKLYRRTKSAAVTIQAAYRGYCARRNFAQMRRVASSIHRRFRMIQERNRFLALKTATLALQRRYRALLLTREVRRQYLSRRRAAVCLQAAFRGMRARRLVKQKHRAASTIQRAFRARREHKKYTALKSSVLAVQRRYRATVAAKAQMRRYQTLRKSSIVIQSAWRGLRVRKDVARWHRAATLIQSKFRKHREEVRFRSARLSAIVIQRHYRALVLQKRDRGYYLKVRSSAVVLQAAFRGRLARGRIGQMHRAATIIQANFKRHKQRLLFRKRRRAALVLQQRFRAMRERNSEMKRYREVRNAAICLQAAFRGMESRKSIRQKHRAATVIQAAFRSRRQKVQFQATRLSVIVIQRCYRARVLQKKERDYFLKIRTSVICLQSFFRGCSERRRIAKMHRAATVIQANFKRQRQQLRFRKQLWAARVLQQRFRAASQRNVEVKRYREVRNAAIGLQAAFRGMKSRQSIRQKHRAATVIQAAFRSRRERVGFQAKRLAAIVIQRAYRAHVLQEKERDYFLRVRSSIICLQAVYRGRLERRRIAEMHRAATVIQANFKRRNQQSTFKKQLWAVCVLQRRFRAQRQKRLEFKRYNKVRNAAICLQAAFRGMKSRQSIRQKHRAATVIQAAFRCRRERLGFQAKRLAAIVIQRAYRAHVLQEKERDYFLRVRSSIICLQAVYRGRLERRRIAQMHRAATVIQANLKRRNQQSTFKKQLWAVCVLQRRFRAQRQKRLEVKRYNKVRNAAICLQAAFRAMKSRQSIRQKHRAATVIQSAFRCRRERVGFQAKRLAAIVIQRGYRAHVLQEKDRDYFLRVRSSIICLQAVYRGRLERRRIAEMHRAATVIQANFKRRNQQSTFKKQLWAVCVLQRRFRAQRQKRLEIKRYNKVRNAAICLQAAFRGMKSRKSLRQMHRAATTIQAAFRAHQQLKRYQKLKSTALTVQRRFRATAAAKSQRKHFLELRRAAVIFQAAYRGRQTRKHIARLHRAATAIQSAYRRRVELVKFETTCASVVLIQKYYRAFIRQRRERSKFLKLKRATVVLQAAYRAHRVRRDIRQQSRAATLIQSYWRCSVQRRLFLKRRAAAVKLQEWVRAMRLGKEERENYLRTRRAAIALQTRYRAWIVRKQELEAASARRRLHFAAAVYHHLSAIKIQRALRAHRVLESAKRRIHSVVVIQNLVRARFQRRRYLAQRRKIVTVQRAVRRWLVRRHNSASVIQRAARRFLLIRRQKKMERGIVKIQALWRGHVSRRLNDNSKVIKLRRRLHEVSAGAREEDKLQNKTSSALDCILRYRHFSSLLEALKNLEAATRLSPVCCEHLVESGATGVIFTLIRSCNRSVPCMDVITYSVQILLNLSKYHKTIEAVYLVENSVETLVNLIQTYREKAGGKVADKGGSIFTKACFLLVLLLQDKSHAVEAMKCPKVLERVTSIYRLTVRKYKMDAERNVAKQKMNAPINGSFYIPATPRKCQPVPRFAPDWVLRKDNLPNIVDPLKAIHMLANTLSIVM
ncbi:abnormal spindle-like microcephaly-associated protein homolog [Hippocampus zosterae]|uniref:abnormal spindle-like microcephaly-associated protein homolog n=1 Tax=Hippocampus zosterae TaxID=109293 RepID=UPI00223CA4F0|nr:abnormal spindle-like microcephaly-associated protein homolog [Hippocampus zosterae]